MGHFYPKTIDLLAEMSPERGRLILKKLQYRDREGVQDLAHAVWIAVKHFQKISQLKQ